MSKTPARISDRVHMRLPPHIRMSLVILGLIVLFGMAYLIARNLRAPERFRNDFQSCLKNGENIWRSPCFKNLAAKWLEHGSVEDILDLMASMQTEPGIKQTCHAFTNFLGQRAYQESRN